jgi:VIT1/CCC1 family predicted Fe2+/Mn2+ transporter
LVLDELFDLSLYRALRQQATGEVATLLDELIEVETRHLAFWQNFFDLRLTALDFGRRLKLRILLPVCRLIGAPAMHLVLEAIEVYGVRKYLSLWKTYYDQPLGAAVRGILIDEFKHEDIIVTRLQERKLNPERIRNIFLGLNDGLVEILGAVSGFFAAFTESTTVLIAGATTAVAGSLSMAAGAYAALSSEQEVKETEAAKKRFLSEGSEAPFMADRPFGSGIVVGSSYFAGALVPLLPIALGAKDAAASWLTGGGMVIVVSVILAFLSGMDIRRRVATNLVLVTAAVVITYLIGTLARSLWGIDV